MRNDFGAVSIEIDDVEACALPTQFEIIGHPLTAEQLEPTGLKRLTMGAMDLIEYARRLFMLERKSFDNFIGWRVRVGVLLLQVRAKLKHGQWIPWLAQVDIHYKIAMKCIKLAEKLADSRGELSTDKLKACLQIQQGADMPRVSMHQVEQALGMRREYVPATARIPSSPEGHAMAREIEYMPYARGATPPVPVVIDGEQAEGVTFYRRAEGERSYVSAREVQVRTGVAGRSELAQTGPIETKNSHFQAENDPSELANWTNGHICDDLEEDETAESAPEQLGFDRLYEVAESLKDSISLISRLDMAAKCTDSLRQLVRNEVDGFKTRLRRLCVGVVAE